MRLANSAGTRAYSASVFGRSPAPSETGLSRLGVRLTLRIGPKGELSAYGGGAYRRVWKAVAILNDGVNEQDATPKARGVSIRFIRPRKPIENAYVASFNGKFRDDCLNEHWLSDGRCADPDQGLAQRLQHGPAAQLAAESHA